MKPYFGRLAITIAFVAFISGCSKKDVLSGVTTGNTENTKATGASANDLLSASKYTSIKIEIQYMPLYPPDPGAISNLVNFFNSFCNKPGGITVVQSMIPSGGKTIYTLDDVVAIEKSNRTVFTTGTQIGMNLIYVDGNYTEANVLGFAYRNTSMCLFGKTLSENSGGIGRPTRLQLESTILEHEGGHLLGLVNLGSAMQTNHEDATHVKHCNNNHCLMYYATETTGITGTIMSGGIPTLDANCRADLTANGGK